MPRPLALSVVLALAPGLDALAHDFEMFEPPDGKIFSGIGNNPSEAQAFEQASAFYCAVTKLYEDFDAVSGHPLNVTSLVNKLNTAASKGQIPQLGLYFAGFDPNIANLPLDESTSLGFQDAFLDKLVAAAKQYGGPLLIAPGYEFNLSGYTPGKFPKAFDYIAHYFQAKDVTNVAWVWNPFVGGAVNVFLDKDPQGNWLWWPSTANWIGANGFNPTVWATQNPINGSSLAMIGLLNHADQVDIPVMILETSGKLLEDYLPTSDPGALSQAIGLWNEHFTPMFVMLNYEPQMKGFIYLSTNWKNTQWPTWGDHRIQINNHLLSAYLQELNKPQYVHANQQTYPRPWVPFRTFKTTLGGQLHFDVQNLAAGQTGALFVSTSVSPVANKVWPYPGKFWLAPPFYFLGTFTAGPNNAIRVSTTIPNSPVFAGLEFHSQWITTSGIPKAMKIKIQ